MASRTMTNSYTTLSKENYYVNGLNWELGKSIQKHLISKALLL
jgi:hypothetical protein